MDDRPLPTATDHAIETAWRQHHGFLHRVANSVLRDDAGSEDAVQEAFSRLAQTDIDAIDDLRGWLTVVVRRVALDRVRSAYNRREAATLVHADEPTRDADGPDPLDRITLDDEVQLALGVVLDRLTPPERTAFVLHDVFGFPFSDIGEIVGRSPAACRQLASRARHSVRAEAPAMGRPDDDLRELAERFVAAASGGDINALMALLDPAIEGTGHQLGRGVIGHFRGRRAVARGVLRFIGPDTGTVLVPVAMEQNLGVVAFRRGEFAAVVQIHAEDGLIRTMHAYLRFEGEPSPTD
jgi:RNA polymerase sigma-70 factor, ECF subfamily